MQSKVETAIAMKYLLRYKLDKVGQELLDAIVFTNTFQGSSLKIWCVAQQCLDNLFVIDLQLLREHVSNKWFDFCFAVEKVKLAFCLQTFAEMLDSIF